MNIVQFFAASFFALIVCIFYLKFCCIFRESFLWMQIKFVILECIEKVQQVRKRTNG